MDVELLCDPYLERSFKLISTFRHLNMMDKYIVINKQDESSNNKNNNDI